MTMTEKEFADFLRAHPEIQYNEKTNHAKQIKPSAFVDEPVEQKKKNKYCNIKVYEDETGFIADSKDNLKGKCVNIYDSIKEFKRWCELQVMQETGEISDLQRQVDLIIQNSFTYEGKKYSAIKYKADFIYIRKGNVIVEDVKPFDKDKQKFLTTKDFNLKWKLLKAKYPEKKFELY